SVELGPGIRFVAPSRSRNSASVSHLRRATTSSFIRAMCAAGPPKAVNPSRRKSGASSRTESAPEATCGCCMSSLSRCRLRIFEQRHEAEVHVQLLVAVEKREARIVGNEVELYLLKAAEHDHILDHPGGRFAANPH